MMGDVYFPVLLIAGIIFILLFVVGFIGMKIRIPGVVLYILLGIGLGGHFSDSHLLYLAGEVGIVLLFFMLGMEFPIRRLAGIAKKVAPAGSLDLFLNLVLTMGICLGFGLDWITSFLMGSVVYATSSSITAKILETSKRMANPEAEFILGLLIFEDIAAPVAVAVLVGLTAGSALTAMTFGVIIGKIACLIIGAVIIGHLVFSRLGRFVDRYISHDTFVLFVVGIALAYGGLALMLNLSEVLGAFLAGIILAEAQRTEHMEHAILPIRDLFLPLFFFLFRHNHYVRRRCPHGTASACASHLVHCRKDHHRILRCQVLRTVKKSVPPCRTVLYPARGVLRDHRHHGRRHHPGAQRGVHPLLCHDRHPAF